MRSSGGTSVPRRADVPITGLGWWGFWLIGTFFLIGLSWSHGAWAQQGVNTNAKSAVSGTVGMMGETYAVTGIEARRPGASAETYADLSFSLFGFQTGVSLLYSTDASGLRQSMNRLGFRATWEWVTIAAGDVNPSFSTYSLRGTTVRGGYVDLQPGPLVVSIVAGQAQRAVAPFSESSTTAPELSLRDVAYTRWLYAARLGLGAQNRTHFHLIGLLARDDKTSIARPTERAAPAENLSLTPDVGLHLFDGRFGVDAQVTASLLTHDTRADEVEGGTAILSGLVTPRTSSRLGFAGEAGVTLDLEAFDLGGQYERIEPGFRSLGIGRQRSDWETFRLQPRLQLVGGRFNLSGTYSRSRNNLLDTQRATLSRHQMGLNAQARLTSTFSVNAATQQFVNHNTPNEEAAPEADVLAQKQVVRTASVAPTATLRQGQNTHTLSVSTAYQSFVDKSPAVDQGLRVGVETQSLTGTLTYALAMPSGISLNASTSVAHNDAPSVETGIFGFNAGVGSPFFERALNVNLNAGLSTNQVTRRERYDPVTNTVEEGDFEFTARQLSLNLNGTYRLPNGDAVQLRMRGLSNAGGELGRSFREFRGMLSYEHTF